MALTATATERVRADIVEHLHLREPALLTSPASTGPISPTGWWPKPSRTSRCSISSARGRAKAALFIARAARAPRRVAAQLDRGRHSRPPLSRRTDAQGARRAPGTFPARRSARHLRHHRLRHGHQQAQRPLCHPLRSAQEHRGLLPGNRPRRTRRPARRMPAALQRGRRRQADAFIEEKPDPAGTAASPASNCGRWSITPNPPPAAAWNCCATSARTFRGTTAAAATIACRRARRSTAPWPRRSFSPASIASGKKAASASGLNHVVEVLTGAETEKIRKWGHDTFPPTASAGSTAGRNGRPSGAN